MKIKQHVAASIALGTLLFSPGLFADDTNFHFQATTVTQAHPAFDSPYAGDHSLSGAYESRTSLTSTAFISHRLWKDAEFSVDPEVTALSGLSGTHGVAGFPNGEIYRVESESPQLNVSRVFIRQVFGLGGETEKVEDDLNQLAGVRDVNRITVTFGKFSLNDYFDDNLYSHDPRTQFLNWALMDNGAWDYAADTRGYTWGLLVEWNLPRWTFRLASALVPVQANSMALDPHFLRERGDNFEAEYRYRVNEHPGTVRALAYMNHADMGSYSETLANPSYNEDITETRTSRVKFGFGLNAEQELTSELGIFARLGWNNGTTETWVFTEIDRTITAGATLRGSSWKRPNDTAGAALIWNGLSRDHADYLTAGGSGFMLGDGGLSYAPEEIFETYYSYAVLKELAVSPDYQFINHPGYNRERGPVHVIGLRLHYQI